MRRITLPAIGADTAPPVVNPPRLGRDMRFVHHDQDVVAVLVETAGGGEDRRERGEVALAGIVSAIDQLGRRAGLAPDHVAGRQQIGAAAGAVGGVQPHQAEHHAGGGLLRVTRGPAAGC